MNKIKRFILEYRINKLSLKINKISNGYLNLKITHESHDEINRLTMRKIELQQKLKVL